MTYYRQNIEPLLHKYQVDIFVSGHVHNYELTCPIILNGTCATTPPSSKERGTIHLTVGSAGHNYQDMFYHNPDENHFPIPNWSKFRTLAFGIGRLKANYTHLYFEFIGSYDHQIHDSFTITK